MTTTDEKGLSAKNMPDVREESSRKDAQSSEPINPGNQNLSAVWIKYEINAVQNITTPVDLIQWNISLLKENLRLIVTFDFSTINTTIENKKYNRQK